MVNKFVFFIQGSAEQPYRLELTLNPVTISCTCPAAINGLLCKHRIQISKGHTYEIQDLTPEIEQVVSIVAEAIKKSEVPDFLKKYDELKAIIKAKKEESEKIFKKYRDTTIAQALGKTTEKEAKRASIALDKIIQDCLNSEAESEELLNALKTVFIRPGISGKDIAELAVES